MSEFNPTRDVVVLFKGDSYTVSVDAAMRTNGWIGGQGVQWVDSTKDEFLVSYSTGLFGGFMLWGSNESSDQYIAYVDQQPAYGYGVLCAGGWLIHTRAFELYTYASRTGGGPLVPISYTIGQKLLFSLRGYWTNEDEWTLSGDPRAPNGYFVGNVVSTPRTNALGVPYLTLQTSI